MGQISITHTGFAFLIVLNDNLTVKKYFVNKIAAFVNIYIANYLNHITFLLFFIYIDKIVTESLVSEKFLFVNSPDV